MGILNSYRPTFSTLLTENLDFETARTLNAAGGQDATLATVMMTRMDDPKLQTQFHRLMLMGGNDSVLETFPLNRKVVQVGRSRRNHVQIKDPMVSVRHLTISVSGPSCVVNDLDSTNGTFINGERLEAGKVLNDGDEIILGQTVLRFAARRAKDTELSPPPQPTRPLPASKNGKWMPVVALSAVLITAAAALLGIHFFYNRTQSHTPSDVARMQASIQPSSANSAAPTTPAPTALPSETAKPDDAADAQLPSLIQRALAEYTAGRLDSGIQTLTMLSNAKEETPEALQAKRLRVMFETIRELHAAALQAQEQKQYTRAIECWDRILRADLELIGERPSYYSAEAEKRVQSLSYAYAMDAYRQKNHKKAKQLCRAILKINPRNKEALALLAKIDAKA